MRSATSSYGPRLVRIEVQCAQTRVSIEMHPQTNSVKRRVFREACSAGHRALSEVRDKVCSLSVDSMFEQSKNVAFAMVSLRSCC